MPFWILNGAASNSGYYGQYWTRELKEEPQLGQLKFTRVVKKVQALSKSMVVGGQRGGEE
jgi:hypothetical protein